MCVKEEPSGSHKDLVNNLGRSSLGTAWGAVIHHTLGGSTKEIHCHNTGSVTSKVKEHCDQKARHRCMVLDM